METENDIDVNVPFITTNHILMPIHVIKITLQFFFEKTLVYPQLYI